MKDFFNIITLFSNESERNLSFLSNKYSDVSYLKEKILEVGKGILDNETIIKGKKVLLKPNWVLHDQKAVDEICLRTNNSFLLSTLELILECHPQKVTIADAPIQSCNLDLILSKEFLTKIDELNKENNIPIIIKDLRRVTFNPKLNNPIKEKKPLSDYLIFDLGKDSQLQPVSSQKNIFRVTDYNPDRLAESHSVGKHKYCISKELFDADIVISIPKIKTHQKTGITGALKNIVGLNGDKDYLPHHRIGGTGFGGDCYPGKNFLRRTSEWMMDNANRYQGNFFFKIFRFTALVIWKLSMPKKVHHLGAGWYGNDTVWRMVMDLNKIVIYGKKDATLSKKPQRVLYSLCDGIIGGQGDGPLNPLPLPLGIISFSNNSSITDISMAMLMDFNIQKIPLLKAAFENIHLQNIDLILNGSIINLSDLSDLAIQTTPPQGWINQINKK